MIEVEPGSQRDRCPHCGGWRSLGHAVGSHCRAANVVVLPVVRIESDGWLEQEKNRTEQA